MHKDRTYIKTEALPSRTTVRHHFGGSDRSRRRRLSLQRHRSVKSLLPTSGIVSATAVRPPRSSHARLPPASSLSFIQAQSQSGGPTLSFCFHICQLLIFLFLITESGCSARSLALLTFIFKDTETNVGSEKCHTSPPSLRGVLQFPVQFALLEINVSDMCISPHPVTNGTYSGQLSPCSPFIFMPPLSCHLHVRLNWPMQTNHYNGVREGSLGAAVP